MFASNSNRFLSRVSSRIGSRFFHASPQALAKLNVEGLAEKVNLKGQNVLVRVDLNVPLDKDDEVTDDTRLKAIVPTTKFLLDKGANVILCSHFGRPKGEVIETGQNGRLTPVVKPLETLLGTSITKVDDCVGESVKAAASSLSQSQVLLLENTRFHAGETSNDPVLSAELSELAHYFVNDAFGTAHRAHSSTVGATKHMEYSAAGYLMEKELAYWTAIMETPVRPLMAIVGGAKVSTKIPVLESLLEHVNVILLGGGLIFTFYKAQGLEIGASLVEDDMVGLAKELMAKADAKGVKLVLPEDVILADKFDNDANTAIAPVTDITGEWMGLDIGPKSIERFQQEISGANTIVFNGPMGVFEMSNFADGTVAVAAAMALATTERGATTIVGGGDAVAAVNQAGFGDKVSHISTGGGASLELLEGKVLPGVAALTEV